MQRSRMTRVKAYRKMVEGAGRKQEAILEETISPTLHPHLCEYITLQTKENMN